MNRYLLATLLFLFLLSTLPAEATRVMGLYVIDESTLMLHLRDGEVRYRDDGTGAAPHRERLHHRAQ